MGKKCIIYRHMIFFTSWEYIGLLSLHCALKGDVCPGGGYW